MDCVILRKRSLGRLISDHFLVPSRLRLEGEERGKSEGGGKGKGGGKGEG